MNIFRKIQYNQYWNIGFCEQSYDDLVRRKELKRVRWLKHPYRDRWFADPFIYRVTDNEIVVFVEECPVEHPKGIISELVIDRSTMKLKDRFVLLEKDSHLSYPAILRMNSKVYVYPESGASGQLCIYEYDEINHRLVDPRVILDEAVADATIFADRGRFIMTATKFPNTQAGLFLFSSDSLFGPFEQLGKNPIQETLSASRNGGSFLKTSSRLYRPAQNCSVRYGGALSIMEVNSTLCYKESFAFGINPLKGRYGLGLHTINYESGYFVIDGYGYYYPVVGRLYHSFRESLRSYI